MKNENLKNIIKKFKDFVQEIKHPHPERDWLLVLGAAFLLIILVVVFSVIFYIFNTPNIPDQKNIDASGEFINKKELQEIITSYEDRAEKFEIIKTGSPNFVDPSF